MFNEPSSVKPVYPFGEREKERERAGGEGVQLCPPAVLHIETHNDTSCSKERKVIINMTHSFLLYTPNNSERREERRRG